MRMVQMMETRILTPAAAAQLAMMQRLNKMAVRNVKLQRELEEAHARAGWVKRLALPAPEARA